MDAIPQSPHHRASPCATTTFRYMGVRVMSCHVNGMSCQIPIDDKHLRDELILAIELIGAMFSSPRRIFERVKVEATR